METKHVLIVINNVENSHAATLSRKKTGSQNVHTV